MRSYPTYRKRMQLPVLFTDIRPLYFRTTLAFQYGLCHYSGDAMWDDISSVWKDGIAPAAATTAAPSAESTPPRLEPPLQWLSYLERRQSRPFRQDWFPFQGMDALYLFRIKGRVPPAKCKISEHPRANILALSSPLPGNRKSTWSSTRNWKLWRETLCWTNWIASTHWEPPEPTATGMFEKHRNELCFLLAHALYIPRP